MQSSARDPTIDASLSTTFKSAMTLRTLGSVTASQKSAMRTFMAATAEGAGTLFMWGEGRSGRLGLGIEDNVADPVPLPMLAEQEIDIRSVSLGDAHTICISGENDVFSWGKGDLGELGHAKTNKHKNALQPAAITYDWREGLRSTTIRVVAAGSDHSVAVTKGGCVYSWGAADDGRLGLGKKTHDFKGKSNRSVPALVATLHTNQIKIVDIACGDKHTVALGERGWVYTWGEGKGGRLGLGDVRNRLVPTRVDDMRANDEGDLSRIVAVAAGFTHSAAVSDRGMLFTWGQGSDGRLGHGDEDTKRTPAVVEELLGERVVRVALGYAHSACCTAMGASYTWGKGSEGQLGHGVAPKPSRTSLRGANVGDNRGSTTGDVLVPRLVEGLRAVRTTGIACGNKHTLACTDAGKLFSWGTNLHGQLGQGDNIRRCDIPELVESMRNCKVLSVAAGARHSACVAIPPGGAQVEGGYISEDTSDEDE